MRFLCALSSTLLLLLLAFRLLHRIAKDSMQPLLARVPQKAHTECLSKRVAYNNRVIFRPNFKCKDIFAANILQIRRSHSVVFLYLFPFAHARISGALRALFVKRPTAGAPTNFSLYFARSYNRDSRLRSRLIVRWTRSIIYEENVRCVCRGRVPSRRRQRRRRKRYNKAHVSTTKTTAKLRKTLVNHFREMT